MKKVIFTLFLFITAVCGYAQENISFKGIPIAGTVSSFCKKLENKGFTKLGSDGNVKTYKGEFTGRPVTIGVIATDDGKNVSTVAVFFDESDNWNTLVKLYENYKDLYAEKYGKPVQCIEKNPGKSDSNPMLMYELFQGNVSYFSTFSVPGGSIRVSIEKGSINYGLVEISYQETQNIVTKRQSDLEDI